MQQRILNYQHVHVEVLHSVACSDSMCGINERIGSDDSRNSCKYQPQNQQLSENQLVNPCHENPAEKSNMSGYKFIWKTKIVSAQWKLTKSGILPKTISLRSLKCAGIKEVFSGDLNGFM